MPVMKICSHIDDQKKCKHFEKATYFTHCMYLRFGEYCGNGDIFNKKGEKVEEKEEKKEE